VSEGGCWGGRESVCVCAAANEKERAVCTFLNDGRKCVNASMQQKRLTNVQQKRPTNMQQKRPTNVQQKRPTNVQQKRPTNVQQKRPTNVQQKRPTNEVSDPHA
jgi:hypothetical protein